MGRYNRIEKNRAWTKEEMMAYIDWDKAEEDRINGIVRKDIETNGFGTRRRGQGHLWAEVDRDIEEQNRLYRSK